MTTITELNLTLDNRQLIRDAVQMISQRRSHFSQRLLDTLYGPSAKHLRQAVNSKLLGYTVPQSKCGYGVVRAELLRAVRATGNCIAAEDSDFEAKALALLGVPVANNDTPVEEQAMAKKVQSEETPTVTPAGGKPKTVCPLTKEQLMAKAPVIKVAITDTEGGGQTFIAGPREFSTGSIGYNVSGKMTLRIDGKAVEFQVGLNVTAVGSKPAK